MNDTAKDFLKILFSLAVFFLTVLLCFLLLGCGVTSRLSTAVKSAPAFLFRSPSAPANSGPTVQQTGLAATPGTVATGNTVTEIPLVPGSSVTINAPAPDPFNPPAPGAPVPVVRVTDHREHVTTPTAYAPPAGPTATEQADADAVTRSYYYAGILAVICALCVWRAHVKAAVCFGVGAVAVVPLTKFISSTAGQIAVLVAVCLGGALFAAWHFMNDQQRAQLKDTIS